MSEVDTQRPPSTRGRSTTRGRGGFRGGPRGSRKAPNGSLEAPSAAEESFEDQGELGEMKKKYAAELSMLKDMFPDWTDTDLVFALQESDGDITSTVDKITQGNVSQFAEVKKPKDRARSKVKEEPATAGAADKPSMRGGRGRGGFESARGGRGRGADRGRGGFRGGRGGHATTNGTSKDTAAASIPTTESTAWDTPTTAEAANGGWDSAAPDTAKEVNADASQGQSSWGSTAPEEATPAATSEGLKSSLIPEGGAKKSWASMFAQSKPPAAPPKQAAAAIQPPVQEQAPVLPQEAPEVLKQQEVQPVSSAQDLPPAVEELPLAPAIADTTLEQPPTIETPDAMKEAENISLAPTQQIPLTEENVEHLPDESHGPATQTVASTTGSVDTRNLTPLPGQQAPIGSRPPMGGYAASAHRAAGGGGRSASFQRKLQLQEQQEAVVLPGHNAVERAAVQFGSMGLNGEPGLDVDEDREEPETQQALQHSPPAQPRASLPPAPKQVQEATATDSLPTPKQAPGLPPASQLNQQQMQEATIAPGLTQDQNQMNPSYNQYSRYGQSAMQQDSGAQQKPYDPFGHQAAQPNQFDQYGSQQAHQQGQQSHAGGFGGLSSTSNDYSQYYTANDQQRNAYNQYYGGAGYGPQDTRAHQQQHAQHDGSVFSQQRSASGFGAGPNESAYGNQVHQQVSNLILEETEGSLVAARDETERKAIIEEMARLKLAEQAPSKKMPNKLLLPSSAPRSCPSWSESIGSTRADPPVQLRHPCQGMSEQRDTSDRWREDRDSPALKSPLPKIYLNNAFSNVPQQAQSRFSEAPGSGQNTPNPLATGQSHQQQHQQQASAPGNQQAQQHSMHQQQAPGHQQQGAGGYGYPYGHPYYQSPYQQAYQNQFGGYGQPTAGAGGYGGGYPNKAGGMYGGGPSAYGMGSHTSYDQHSASPANAGAFGQNQGSSMRSASGISSGLGGGLDEYGRGSAQSSSHQSSAFGMTDPFARTASGFGGQGGYQQQNMTGPEDSLKPFDASKSGPSPALGQPGRPGSAANSAQGSNQSGLPPPQSQHSGFGGYPGFPSQGNQYGGLGGLGGHQQGAGQGAYGSAYGAGNFSQYGSYGSRGGWGSNYGAH
ncbi:CUE domain [Teratosphaeria destructans]|uniref:RNA polymerase II degradation factor 1 n=1 Tax=Teratosphaeria destructans TaxID=418781 RepID=A0A9W7W6U1_9PEZI|nr:CUE domain [Teratosphaeria destructans]